MKNTINVVILFSLFFFAACTEKEAATTEPLATRAEYHFTKTENDEERSFPTYRVSQSSNPTDNDFQREAQAAAILNELNPILLRTGNVRLNAQERLKALADYKSFLTEHQSDSVLVRHFRDKYSKILLTSYDFLHQSEPQQLLFLVSELITAKTGRFSLTIQGLDKLQQTTNPVVFATLVNETQNQVNTSLGLHLAAQRRLSGMLDNLKTGKLKPTGTLKKDFMVALLEKDDFRESIQMLEGYKKQLQKY